MAYLTSVLAVAAGVVVLLMLLLRLIGPARRLAGIVLRSRAHFADQVRLLAALIAAVRAKLEVWRHRRGRRAHT